MILDDVALAEASSPYVVPGGVGLVFSFIKQVYWQQTKFLMKRDEKTNLFMRGLIENSTLMIKIDHCNVNYPVRYNRGLQTESLK